MSLLPKQKTKPTHNLSEKVIGIYGQAGIGKSTLASMFPNVIFAATESGLSHLEVAKVNILNWDKPLTADDRGNVSGGFIPFCAEIMAGDHNHEIICIDTYDNLCKLCTEWQCTELDIDDISAYKRFGAYHMVTAELHRVMTKLSQSVYGLILTSHVKMEETESKTRKWSKATLSISGKNKNIMVDMCDMLLYIENQMNGEEEISIIKTKPSIYWDAKDKSTLLPEIIEFPSSKPQIAYEVIKKVFNIDGKKSK